MPQSYRLVLSSPARINLIQRAKSLNPTFSLERYLDLIARRPAPDIDTPPILPTQDTRDDDYDPLYERIPTTTQMSATAYKNILRQAHTIYPDTEPITDPITLDIIEQPNAYNNRLVSMYLEALGLNLIPSPYDEAPEPVQEPKPEAIQPIPTPALGIHRRANLFLSDQAYHFLQQKAAEGQYLHTKINEQSVQSPLRKSTAKDPIQAMIQNRSYAKKVKYHTVRTPTSQRAGNTSRGLSEFIIALTPEPLGNITYTDTRPISLLEDEAQYESIRFPFWTPTTIEDPNDSRKYRCLSVPDATIKAFANLALTHLIFDINESRVTERIPISHVYKKRYASNALEAIGLQMLTPSKWPTYPRRRYFRELSAKKNYTSERF